MNNRLRDKKVAIVHGRDLLLNEKFPDKFRKLVNQKLEARGVELILGDYVAKFPEGSGGEVAFRSGKRIQADLIVRTFLAIGTLFLTDNGIISCRFLRMDPNQIPPGYPMLWAKIHCRPKDS